MKKKWIVFIVFMLIVGVAIIKSTPKLVQSLKDNTMQVIDYAALKFNPKDEFKEDQIETLKEIKDGLSDSIITLQLGDNELQLNTNYNEEIFQVETLFTGHPININLKKSTSDLSDINVLVDGKNINENDSIILSSLNNQTFIEIKLEYGGFERSYFVQTLPMDFPKISKSGHSEYEGDYYSDFFIDDNHFIYKMSNEGDILYYKNAKENMYTFEKWKINNDIFYSYFIENNYEDFDIPGAGLGEFVVLNEFYEEIDRVTSLPSKDYNIHSKKAEAHDFIILDDSHYMIMNYVMDTPRKEHLNDDIKINTRILASYIQEIKNDELVWEWISTDYDSFYTGALDNNDFSNSKSFSADYMHVNSLFIDPKDDNLIMSFRSQDAVVKVDKETKEILWIFGGVHDDFNLTEEQKVSRQHHATITAIGNLLIFDNGTVNEQTRIVEVELDEENKELITYKEFQIDGAFARYAGSVQKLNEENDVFLIGWGLAREGQYALMSEVDFKHEQVLTEVLEKEIENDSYRFLKFE